MQKPADKCYFICRFETDDGEIDVVHGYSNSVSADKFFTDISKKECFSDCEPVDVIEIVWHNTPVWYMRWKPGMLFQYGDMERHVVWEGCFPEWDH